MDKELEERVTAALENHEQRIEKLENLQKLEEDSTQSSTKSSEAEAQLKESQDKVAELEEALAKATGKTMADFTPEEKAAFVITWAKGLTPEDKAIFAEGVGIPIAKATDAEVAEAEAQRKADGKEAEEPWCIQGKTERPGYKHYPYLNLSVYVGEDELTEEREELVKGVLKRFNEETEKFGDQVVNKLKLHKELINNLAEIQRRRGEQT